MRTALFCLVLLLSAGVAWAPFAAMPRLHLRELVGVASFAALGAMLYWHFHK